MIEALKGVEVGEEGVGVREEPEPLEPLEPSKTSKASKAEGSDTC